MAEDMYKTLETLDKLTKTNLGKEFELVRDFCTSSINFANRCNTHVAFKDLLLAEMAAHRLREDSERRFVDGFITKDEFAEISNQSLSLIYDELTVEIINALVKSCDCARGSVPL